MNFKVISGQRGRGNSALWGVFEAGELVGVMARVRRVQPVPRENGFWCAVFPGRSPTNAVQITRTSFAGCKAACKDSIANIKSWVARHGHENVMQLLREQGKIE